MTHFHLDRQGDVIRLECHECETLLAETTVQEAEAQTIEAWGAWLEAKQAEHLVARPDCVT